MDLEDLLNKILSLEGKEDEIIEEITKQKETQDFIIFLLQEQLFNTGADGKGKTLGIYTPFTISEKKRKGQPFDRVTLKDSGDFYRSYFIETFKGGFIVDADDEKDDKYLFEFYGDDVILPNPETLELIADYYVQQLIEYFKKLLI